MAIVDVDLNAQTSRIVSGAVTGRVASTLRWEAAAEMVFALIAYRLLGGSWWMFAVLFLVPDVSMLGYLINSRVGAITYNVGHSYICPSLLALVGWFDHVNLLYLLAAIWFAHIGFDRMLGFGLKYPQHFGSTHLGGKIRQLPVVRGLKEHALRPQRPH